MKRCGKCGRELPETGFRKCSANPDGLSAVCKECHGAYAKGAADRRIRKEFRRMLAVAREDTATVHIAGVGDVEIELPPMEGKVTA